MALGTFIAGRYSGTKNAVALGLTRDGFTHRMTSAQELVNRSDGYGEAIVDTIYRGGNVTVDFIAKEYLASIISAMWPFGARGVLSDTTTPIGRLASGLADAFVLTAQANTPAATSPASHTAAASIIAANFDVQTLFDSRLRELPIRLQYLPTLIAGSKVGWFVET